MNDKTIIVNEKSLQVKEINGQRLVTFKDIDELHERPSGTASRNFRTNKKYLTLNEDYYLVKPNDFQSDEFRCLGFDVPNRGLTLLTESGYLMLVKSFTDDLAWKVQKQLVNTYFKSKALVNNSFVPTELVNYVSNIDCRLNSQDNLMCDLKQEVDKLSTLVRLLIPAPRYTSWKTEAYSKIKNVANKLKMDNKDILKELYSILNIDYGIDLNKLKLEYLQLHPNVNNIPTIDIVDIYNDVKQVFDSVLDNFLVLRESK